MAGESGPHHDQSPRRGDLEASGQNAGLSDEQATQKGDFEIVAVAIRDNEVVCNKCQVSDSCKMLVATSKRLVCLIK